MCRKTAVNFQQVTMYMNKLEAIIEEIKKLEKQLVLEIEKKEEEFFIRSKGKRYILTLRSKGTRKLWPPEFIPT
jgi:flagellar biosynthesis chaperone FliJ